MPLEVHQFPCLSDNYGFLLHDPESGETACIDTPDGVEYLAQAEARGWRISQIWNTHWHPDHAGGNAAIVAATGCSVTGPAEVEKLGTAPDRVVAHGDLVRLGAHEAQVIDVSGHTNGHIAYHNAADRHVFTGDALFSMGCGRMFEGKPGPMWEGLKLLRSLPDETLVYCGHEYTLDNARFAQSVDPRNAALNIRAAEVKRMREAGRFTIPVSMGMEKATNPFLRADQPVLAKAMGLDADVDPSSVFAALRSRKDSFG